MDQIEKFFEDFFLKKIPYQIPTRGKDVLVQIAPYIAIVVLLFSLPAILAIFGLGSMVSMMGSYYGVHLGTRYYMGIAILAVQVVLLGMSIPGLMRREKKGWMFVYYSSLLSGAYAVLSSYGIGNLIWALLGAAIGLYIAFQVKSYYK